MRVFTTLVATAAVMALTAACGQSPVAPSQSGNLRLMLTDAPFDEASALHVTFTEVKAHRADGDGGWMTVPFAGTPAATARTCNLKKLEGPFDVLGVASLPAGEYTQLRLVVSNATIYFGGTPTTEGACLEVLAPPSGDPTSAPLEIPSGEVRLIHPFQLTTDGTTTIELDFDGGQSVRETGNGRFRMTPVIRILSVNSGA